MTERTSRQGQLLTLLKSIHEPVTGSELATSLGVTRQVVVHDIALLRAGGANILSTPRGYWLQDTPSGKQTYVLSVCHPPERTETELLILVDFGVYVKDVLVEHPVYGELKGSLHLASRRDVQLFLEQIQGHEAALLSTLTGGFHLHTVEAPDSARVLEAVAELRRNGIQVREEIIL